MKKHEHSSAIHPPLVDKPGVSNWVERTGGIGRRSYVYRIAKHLVSDQGYTEGHAIASAVNTVKLWAVGRNHGGGKVSPKVQAKAVKDLAVWESKAKLARTTALTLREDMETIEMALTPAQKKNLLAAKAGKPNDEPVKKGFAAVADKVKKMTPGQRKKAKKKLQKAVASKKVVVKPDMY